MAGFDIGSWFRGSEPEPVSGEAFPEVSDEDLRQGLLDLAGSPGVERAVFLRPDGGLFCGRNDAERESFAGAIHQIGAGARAAAKRMGLGRVSGVILEGDQGSVVLSIGRSCCGAQGGLDAPPVFLLDQMDRMAGRPS